MTEVNATDTEDIMNKNQAEEELEHQWQLQLEQQGKLQQQKILSSG
jgi:hypothetical protein